MKNVIAIDATNNYVCDLISNINDGSNTLFLQIKADNSLNPKLELPSGNVSITDNDFLYEIPSGLFTGSGTLQFRITDSAHTGEYFQITKTNATGNLVLKQKSNFEYEFAVKDSAEYELPIATTEKLGGVIVGKDLTITPDGVLNSDVPSCKNPIPIEQGSNLNDFKSPGYYLCDLLNNGVSNTPYGSGRFTLEVRTAGTDRTLQIYRYFDTSQLVIFQRYFTPNAWGSWKRYAAYDSLVNMTGATSSAAGKAGFVPAPAAGKQETFLRGDGTWVEPGDDTGWTKAPIESGVIDPSTGQPLRYRVKNGVLYIQGAVGFTNKTYGDKGICNIPIPTGYTLELTDNHFVIGPALAGSTLGVARWYIRPNGRLVLNHIAKNTDGTELIGEINYAYCDMSIPLS